MALSIGSLGNSQRIRHLNLTDSSDGLAQTDELAPVDLICSSKVVDDACDGLLGLWIPVVMRQVVVGDDGAVFVLPLGCSQVHAQYYSIYHEQNQEEFTNSFTYEIRRMGSR